MFSCFLCHSKAKSSRSRRTPDIIRFDFIFLALLGHFMMVSYNTTTRVRLLEHGLNLTNGHSKLSTESSLTRNMPGLSIIEVHSKETQLRKQDRTTQINLQGSKLNCGQTGPGMLSPHSRASCSVVHMRQ